MDGAEMEKASWAPLHVQSLGYGDMSDNQRHLHRDCTKAKSE